jgi:ElaB/YqjD/DUF883 family membrane-anchored ribosome-binding protein
MNDEFAGPERVTGEAVGNKEAPADLRDNQTAGRVQRAVAQAHGAADQISGVVRARPLAAAAIALGVGYLVGRRR